MPSENIAEEPEKKAAIVLHMAIAEFAIIAPYIALFDDPAIISLQFVRIHPAFNLLANCSTYWS